MRKIPVPVQPLPTYDILNKMATILGTTKMSLIPILGGISSSSSIGDVQPYGPSAVAQNYSVRNDAGEVAIAATRPQEHNGIWSIENVTTVKLTAAADHASHSFGNAATDDPFSCGIWVFVGEALGTARSLVAKYNAAGLLREYDFRFGTNGKLILELYDESADTTEIATSAGTALTPFQWSFCVATYDGGETDPVINLYLNGVSVHDGTSVESGAYVAMEDTATPITFAAAGAAGGATQSLQGRFALPFITGKQLSAAEVGQLYYYGQRLLGLVA